MAQSDDAAENRAGALRDGSSGATFEAVFRAHAETCVRFARQYVRDMDVAQDIVHDVFLTCWLDGTLTRVHTSAREYLLRAVRNRALNVVRHRRVVERHADAEVATATLFPPVAYNAGELALESDDVAAAVNAALNTLSPRVREIFVLHRHVGMTPAEIAGTLGISVATVYNQVSKAIHTLSDQLAEWRDTI